MHGELKVYVCAGVRLTDLQQRRLKYGKKSFMDSSVPNVLTAKKQWVSYLYRNSSCESEERLKNIQICVNAETWKRRIKICAKTLFDSSLFTSPLIISPMCSQHRISSILPVNLVHPPSPWDWLSSRLLPSTVLIWHEDHSCFWALYLLLELLSIMYSLSLELSPEFSFPGPYHMSPSLYLRSYAVSFQILLPQFLKKSLFFSPKPLLCVDRLEHSSYPLESSQTPRLYGLHSLFITLSACTLIMCWNLLRWTLC